MAAPIEEVLPEDDDKLGLDSQTPVGDGEPSSLQ